MSKENWYRESFYINLADVSRINLLTCINLSNTGGQYITLRFSLLFSSAPFFSIYYSQSLRCQSSTVFTFMDYITMCIVGKTYDG